MVTSSSQEKISVPPITSRFTFEIHGLEIGWFTEVSGLSVQLDVEELPEGGNNGFVHKLPKQVKWPNLVLKRGIIKESNVLFEWFANCSGEGLQGKGNKLDMRDGAVQLYDSRGKVARRWDFSDAFPVKWTGPKLAASANEFATEELEVCHCGFKPSK